MTTVRLYINTPLDKGNLISLQENQIHHLRNVLRLEPGDPVQLFNSASGEWLGELETLTKSHGVVLLQQQLKPRTIEPNIELLFAPLKQEAMHYLVEKTTELGVGRLAPITTEFTQVHKINQEKIARYCIDAAQQCERLSIPEIAPLQSLQKALQGWNPEKLLIICLERQDSIPITQLLQQLDPRQEMAFLIGPEGGFGPKDISLLTPHPFVRFCQMGPRILRAETAAVAALTCYQSLKGDWTYPADPVTR